MCGIVGMYDPAASAEALPRVLHAMNDAIRHRGPDDDGIFAADGVGLGMRRLSIIDLDGGKQPITNEDGSIIVVFNGEIYNYQQLTRELQQAGHVFATASDTEVIVHLYETYGADCVEKLRGMYGFALWDARNKRLLLARDRLGIKPLYYTQQGDRLIWSSEIKALLRHPSVDAQLDLDALNNFLTLKYVPAPQTMFASIAALPPGHLLICDERGVQVRAYWDLSFDRANIPVRHEEEYAEELADLLRESVQAHLVSDVPFGAFLSGGLDSSTIVALMSQFLSQPVKTFSVGFSGEGESFSELPFARQVARHYNTDHHEVLVGPNDLINLIDKVVWHLDQPIADQAALATYMVADLASQHVKMVLTGEGGDELFAGYARYAGERLSPVFKHIPQPARSLALAASTRLPGLRRPKVALYALCQPDEVTRLVNWFPLFNHDMKASLVSETLRRTLDPRSTNRVIAAQLDRTDAIDPLSRMLYVDTKLWLPDDLLARGDKMTMAASIEGRVPLLDHHLVEFAASLPPQLKLKGLTRKYLLKQVAKSWLPPEIIDRKKQGFPMPISLWFRREARALVRDVLSPAAVRRRGLFDVGFVQRLLDEHERAFADHGSLIWSLLNIELWHRQFIDTPMPSAV